MDAFDGVADETSRRVREVLAESERHARQCDEEAERAGAAAAEAAAEEAERLFEDARARARQVARDRADHLAAIQASLTARGPAVLEGLEGAGATRAGLEALIAALAATAERVLAEADAGEPRGSAGPDEENTGTEGSEEVGEDSEAEAADEEVIVDAVVVDDPVEDAGDAVSGADATVSAPVEEDGDEEATPAEAPVALASVDGNGASSDGGATPYEGALPEGAPMVRRPERSRERDVRFTALLLALRGSDRGEVEEHLRTEHDVTDPAPILDEVFGRADARA